jgi:hypothetical protein
MVIHFAVFNAALKFSDPCMAGFTVSVAVSLVTPPLELDTTTE